MNKYLSDTDSDFSEFSSVDSINIRKYEEKYKNILKITEKVEAENKIHFTIHKKTKTQDQVIEETK